MKYCTLKSITDADFINRRIMCITYPAFDNLTNIHKLYLSIENTEFTITYVSKISELMSELKEENLSIYFLYTFRRIRSDLYITHGKMYNIDIMGHTFGVDHTLDNENRIVKYYR